MNELKFALYAIKKNVQNGAELRTSFLMNIVGMTINNSAFVFLWVYFVKSVGIVGGWTVADIIALQGYVTLCFGLVLSVGAGIRKLADYTASGFFDQFMLSPKNLLVRVATSALNVSALGDVIFGCVCLIIYAVLIQASIIQVMLMLLLVFVTAILFLAVVIATYSVSFYFVEASTVANSLFELFITPAMFHGGAFQGVMRFIFIFVIPALLIGILPVEIVRDVAWDKLLLISVLTIIWLFVSIRIFYGSIKKYESSNFMTFGS